MYWLFGNMTLPVLLGLAIVVTTIAATWSFFEWYWTDHRSDPDATAHFGRATWARRRMWIVGIAVAVIAYLSLLLK